MQKILGLFLIMILTILPIFSASASLHTCQHSNHNSDISIEMPHDMSTMQHTMNMDSQHDCCNDPEKHCGQGGSCDCDSEQVTSSAITSIQRTYVDYQPSIHDVIVPDLYISKNSESLYRPPITNL